MKHKILFLAASPAGMGEAALGREAHTIQEEMDRAGYRDRFAFVTRWAARPQDLLREMRDHSPTIVHFAGHGGVDGLYFEGEDGGVKVVTATELMDTFGAAGGSTAVVVLNACFSQAQAAALCRHVACAIGTSCDLDARSAREFSLGFYGAIGANESIATAYRHGVVAVSTAGLPNKDQIHLTVREGVDAGSLTLATTPPPELARRLKLRRRLAQLYRDTGATSVREGDRLEGEQVDLNVVVLVQGYPLRIAISCFPAGSPADEVRVAVTSLRSLQNRSIVDRTFVVIEETAAQLDDLFAGTPWPRRETVATLSDALLSFSDYLENQIAEIQELPVFRCGWLIEPQLGKDSDEQSRSGDEVFDEWLASGSTLLVILGDYGTGKTTFVLSQFLRAYRRWKASDGVTRIPVLVRLREANQTPSLRSLVTDILINQQGVKLPNFARFRDMSKEGRFLLFLDGLDEMSVHADHAQLTRNIDQCLELVDAGARVVLTSRPNVARSYSDLERALHNSAQAHRAKAPLIVDLPYFAPAQIQAYVAARSPERNDLYPVLESTYNLLELASRPFLLDLMIQELPSLLARGDRISPATVYESYVGHWLLRDEWRVLDRPELRVFAMSELAAAMLMEGLVGVTSEELVALLSKLLLNFDTRELRQIENDVRLCSFVDMQRSGELTFTHRSFAEYFLGRKLARDLADDPRRADALLDSERLGPEVVGFCIDVVFNVHFLAPEQILAFCLPVKYGRSDGTFEKVRVIGNEPRSYQQNWSEPTASLLEACNVLLTSERAGSKFRGRLLLALVFICGDPEDVAQHVVARHASGVKELVPASANLAYLVGNTKVGPAVEVAARRALDERGGALFAHYVDHVSAYTQREKFLETFTGASVEPNEELLRTIEDHVPLEELLRITGKRTSIDLAQTSDVWWRDEFRRKIMGHIGALAIEGRVLDYRTIPHLYTAIRVVVLGFDPDKIWIA